MKFKRAFVSNSSSTSFVILNISNEEKTLVDFVKEVGHEQILWFLMTYRSKGNYEDNDKVEEMYQVMLNNAERRLQESPTENTWVPKEKKIISFGDSDGDLLGEVFDYSLREKGITKNWIWKFHESNR